MKSREQLIKTGLKEFLIITKAFLYAGKFVDSDHEARTLHRHSVDNSEKNVTVVVYI
jgi:hypothetical protein